jgi:hypothetical protein
MQRIPSINLPVHGKTYCMAAPWNDSSTAQFRKQAEHYQPQHKRSTNAEASLVLSHFSKVAASQACAGYPRSHGNTATYGAGEVSQARPQIEAPNLLGRPEPVIVVDGYVHVEPVSTRSLAPLNMRNTSVAHDEMRHFSFLRYGELHCFKQTHTRLLQGREEQRVPRSKLVLWFAE